MAVRRMQGGRGGPPAPAPLRVGGAGSGNGRRSAGFVRANSVTRVRRLASRRGRRLGFARALPRVGGRWLRFVRAARDPALVFGRATSVADRRRSRSGDGGAGRPRAGGRSGRRGGGDGSQHDPVATGCGRAVAASSGTGPGSAGADSARAGPRVWQGGEGIGTMWRLSP